MNVTRNPKVYDCPMCQSEKSFTTDNKRIKSKLDNKPIIKWICNVCEYSYEVVINNDIIIT